MTSSWSPRTELAGAPFVSVIMNCYNSARYLREALESVRTQTFSDWEIIFWDNQSTDESATIFKSFDDPRFHYFLAPEHTILGKAKGLAIERAQGKWLAFLDCDDLWVPEKLEWQAAIVAEEGPDLGLVYGRMQYLVEDDARSTSMGRHATSLINYGKAGRLLEGNIFAELLKENFIPQPSVMLQFSAYLSVGGIDSDIKHAWDFDLSLKILKTHRARAVQQVCCYYRVHSSNLTHAHMDITYLEPIAIIETYLPERAAANGLRAWKTAYAVNLLKRREFKSAIAYLLGGDLAYFLKKGYEHFSGRLGRLFRF